jgi:hypothetical protein
MNIGPIVHLVLDAAAAWNVRYGDDGGVAAVMRCGPRQPVGAADRFRHEPLHCAMPPYAKSTHCGGDDSACVTTTVSRPSHSHMSAASRGWSANGVWRPRASGPLRGRAKIRAAPPWVGASSISR